VCPKCGFLSAGRAASNDPFGVGNRVRCVGYPVVGAGTDTAVHPHSKGDMCVHIMLHKGTPPRLLTLRFAEKRNIILCRTRACR
jgi:hypothetical protein